MQMPSVRNEHETVSTPKSWPQLAGTKILKVADAQIVRKIRMQEEI